MHSLILHGRSSLELHKWRNLRVSINRFQNASSPFSNSFSSATTAAEVISRNVPKGKNFTVSYLVDSLGLATKLAESISSKISFEEKRNPDSVLRLLRSHGFADSQISSIIRSYPQLLIADAEKSLGPKLLFLQSRGASMSELTDILSKVPKILGKREGKSISRYYDFVKDILQGKQDNMNRNVSALRELGMPQNVLYLLFTSYGGLPVHGKGKFEESLKKVVHMGFDPTTLKFVQALRVVYRISDKAIEEKVDVYKRLGLSVGDVWTMFKKWPLSLTHSEKKITRKFETLKKCGLLEDEILSVFKKFPQCIGFAEQKIDDSVETFIGLGFSRDEFVMMVKRFPQCLNLSAESVKKKTQFVVNSMNWSLKAVVSFPTVLGYSLEKRTAPRCNVIKALMSKGFLGSKLPPISSVLAITHPAFLNKYVMKHDDKKLVADLMAIFTGSPVK